jgi:DhnA family fructose-bisphosphate aldolase class Ia
MSDQIARILGSDAEGLLRHECRTVPRDTLHLPGPTFIDDVMLASDRSSVVLRNLQTTFNHGRLGGTGYLSILPVDRGIEHSAGASFAPAPEYFDPGNIVKQKQPTNNGGYKAIGFGKTHRDVYEKLTSDNLIDLTRYQVANCYMGRIPMINSGGPSGKDDLQQAVKTAVINKRAGGAGLITGRKAFQRPMKEGISLLNAVQDVYLDKDITMA